MNVQPILKVWWHDRQWSRQVHVHLWSFSCIGHAKDKEVYSLCCGQKARAERAQSFTLWQQAAEEITRRDHSIVACSLNIYLCVSSCTYHSHFQHNANWDNATTSPPFCNEPHLSFFMKLAPGTTFTSWSLTAPLCCDCKAWAASAQSFTLWQQKTIEITRRAHSISACSRHLYICCPSRKSCSWWIA